MFLVDSGSPDEEARVLAKLKQLGRIDLKVIWTTHAHYDHYGSGAALREFTGARIGVHPDDAETMSKGLSTTGIVRRYGFVFSAVLPVVSRIHPLPPTKPDFTLEDGETLERWGLAASILHTPGHTPGSSCLILEDRTAFAGDLLGSNPHPGLQRLLATDWSQLPASLARLQAARPARVYIGHSKKPVSGDILLGM